MACAACLTDFNVFMVKVADLAYCCHAFNGNVAKLARRKSEKSIDAFFSHKLCSVACSSCKLAALAGIKLNVMNESTDRDVCKRKSVAGLNVGIGSCENLVAYFKADRSKDVALYAVGILNKSDVCRTVGVVFKRFNGCFNVKFVSLEVDYSVFSAVSAAARLQQIQQALKALAESYSSVHFAE